MFNNFKYLFALLLCVYGHVCLAEQNVDSMLTELNSTLKNERVYINLKLRKIELLKKSLVQSTNKGSKYEAYFKLYEEYKTFNYDSAFTYSNLMLKEATSWKDQEKIAYAKLKIGFTMLSSGMFKETFEILNDIDSNQLKGNQKIEYYALASRSYYDLADFDRNGTLTEKYNRIGGEYIKKALSILPSNSYEYQFLDGLKLLRDGNYDQAIIQYQKLVKSKTDLRKYAINASTLAYLYSQKGKTKKALELLVNAAIADIKSGTKETTALLSLSDLLYKDGDIKNSYTYIKQAMDDANFYGARHREIQVGIIMPIIEGERIRAIEAQRQQLLIYSLLITILVVSVVFFSIIIFKQLKKLKKADEVILEANDNLRRVNQNLAEANALKNDYIGYYFNINSRYLEKLERFKKTMEKKLQNKSFDDALRSLQTLHLDEERKELLNTFDKIFLKVFPDFIVDFNGLFLPQDQIVLNNDELMNAELRIFALIRIGIHDNERISKILGYSMNTIYAYKNRVKTKSIVNNDEFEKKLMGFTAAITSPIF